MKHNYLHRKSDIIYKIFSFLFLLLLMQVKLFAQDVEHDVIDKESAQKKVCWPVVPTSKTQATTNKMETDTAAIPVPNAGGLAIPRNLYTAVEVPNSPFPNPATIEIYDLLGNPLIINGTTINFAPSSFVASLAANDLGTTPGYHWVGYQSNAFQPDNIATYFYNIFHRWFGGMPGNYHNFGGRQWNSDNSGFANYSDTTFLPHPISVSILQPVSCYGFNDGALQANTNPLNFYTYALNSGPPQLANTFSNLSAGIYTVSIIDSFNNVYDTIITLSQPPSLGSSYTVNNCGAYMWPINGGMYTSSGMYLFSTMVGPCPKVDTLNLTITNSITNSSNITAYNSYTWPINGFTYNSSGTYFFNSTIAPGCQQFAVLNLNIINTPYNMNLQIDQEISCHGANDGSILATAFPMMTSMIYILDGGVQSNATGFFAGLSPGVHTVCANSGSYSVCKTITLLNPAPLSITILSDSLVSCLGIDGKLSAIITGGTFSPFGYLTFWRNALNVLLNPSPNNYDTSINNLPAGLYTLEVEDDHGCMAMASTILQTASLSVSATYTPIRCNGGPTTIYPSSVGGIGEITFTINNMPVSGAYLAGTFTVTATDTKGCTATTVLTITQPNMEIYTDNAETCGSYYWSINGTTYNTTGTYYAMLTTLGGCTIINILNLTINSSTSSSVSVNACNSYTWPLNGITYTSSGSYTTTNLNSNGCVHYTTLNLVIHFNTTSTKVASACSTYNWTAIGASNPYTASGIYTATSINPFGCLHTATLYLTLNNSSSTQNITACNNYTWPVNGITYTTSGVYTQTSINTQGCTHTATLQLTINYTSYSSTTISANNFYTWPANGITYTSSGVYNTSLLNALGCDSILTLNLTIIPTNSVLNLRCFIQGYFDGVNGMVPVLANQGQPTTSGACDTIVVELHNPNPPFNTLHNTKVVMQQNGQSICTFPPLSANYYIAVKHRNGVTTWSMNPVFIGSGVMNYNFTNAANKAYGFNQKEVAPGKWAMFSGDIVKDENVDLLDMALMETDISNFEFGYQTTDLNGDGNVDLLDKPMLEMNMNDFIYAIHP